MFCFWPEPEFCCYIIVPSTLQSSAIFMLRPKLKRIKISAESINRRRQRGPLIGRFITTGTQHAMSDVNKLFEHEYEHHEDEDEESAHNNAAAVSLKPMNSIWDCEYLCITTQEDGFGKNISGWTCAYCPHPGNVGGYVFCKSINETKALAHVLKMKSQDVAICNGVIPYPKKKTYKSLYNVN
jgi:hypothetical protein